MSGTKIFPAILIHEDFVAKLVWITYRWGMNKKKKIIIIKNGSLWANTILVYIWALSVFRYYNDLTSCKKPEKNK